MSNLQFWLEATVTIGKPIGKTNRRNNSQQYSVESYEVFSEKNGKLIKAFSQDELDNIRGAKTSYQRLACKLLEAQGEVFGTIQISQQVSKDLKKALQPHLPESYQRPKTALDLFPAPSLS